MPRLPTSPGAWRPWPVRWSRPGGQVLELRGDEALCVFADITDVRRALQAAPERQARCAAVAVADPLLPLRVGMGLM
jgi:hypothetical protein